MHVIIACARLSIGGSERKQRRAKKQASQGERAGARGVWDLAPSSLPRPSSFFPRSPAAQRTDPLTEGLEQANFITIFERSSEELCYNSGFICHCKMFESNNTFLKIVQLVRLVSLRCPCTVWNYYLHAQFSNVKPFSNVRMASF